MDRNANQVDRGGGNEVQEGGGNENRDRISDLPDCLIAQILSCLPAEEAVRTSVLSKCWEYKWTSIYLIRVYREENFDRVMDGILFNVRNIQSFDLLCSNATMYDASRINSWISTIFRHNVESVEIAVLGCDASNILPPSVLKCTSLRILKLDMRCTLKVSDRTSFLKLTSLILDGVKISNGNSNTDTLTFKFPVLKTLKLGNCEWLNVRLVKIGAPALSFVAFEASCPIDDNSTILILGARLAKFKILGFVLNHFLLVGSEVDCADLYIMRNPTVSEIDELAEDGLKLRRLLSGLSNLETLKLQNYLAIAETISILPLPKYDKLRWLAILDESENWDTCNMFAALFELLHAAPFLKLLDIDMYFFCREAGDFGFEAMGPVPSCLVSHLEEVNLYCLSGDAREFQLAEFIIVKGAKLKQLTFSTMEDVEERTVREKLSRFPQASASLTIVTYK